MRVVNTLSNRSMLADIIFTLFSSSNKGTIFYKILFFEKKIAKYFFVTDVKLVTTVTHAQDRASAAVRACALVARTAASSTPIRVDWTREPTRRSVTVNPATQVGPFIVSLHN